MHIKLKIEKHEPYLKPGVNPGAPECFKVYTFRSLECFVFVTSNYGETLK